MLAHAIVTALMVLLMPPFGCAESEPPVATDRSPQDSQDGQTGESEGEATEEPAADATGKWRWPTCDRRRRGGDI